MKVDSFLSKYLKATDLPKPALYTIERVDEEEVGDETKLVVYFLEVPQGVVLGKTTIGQIVEALGPGSDDTDNWIGHAIVAFNDTTVMYQGRKCGGIRFRAPNRSVPKKIIEVKAASNSNGVGDQDDLPF